VSFVKTKPKTEMFDQHKSKTHLVEGYGEVQLQLINDKKFLLKNILYILGITRKLLLVKQTGKQSSKVEVVYTTHKTLVKDRRERL
jgi:hypothetical protein